jgi:glutaconate CoA-transferase subunit B
MPSGDIRPEEVLIDALVRWIAGARHVAVGANSPIPSAAAFLAQHLGGGRPQVSLQESPRHNLFTDGGRELFDVAGQGRIDVFFLSGAQIDGAGNINLVTLGEYAHPKRRFPGSYGSSYLYFVVPSVILVRTEHSRRTLVEKVDFVSAPGTSPPNVYRPGGPTALVTPFCTFAFDKARGRFRLERVHPGHTLEEVLDNTGFAFDRSGSVPTAPPPTPEVLKAMRGIVAPRLREIYPQFVSSVFGLPAAGPR